MLCRTLHSYSVTKRGHASGGGKDGEEAKKTIADASLTVYNAYVKEESNIEKLDPISSTRAKLGEGNSYGQEQRSSMSIVHLKHCLGAVARTWSQ